MRQIVGLLLFGWRYRLKVTGLDNLPKNGPVLLLGITAFLAKLSFDSQDILYLNAAIGVVGFTFVLRKLKAIL